MSLFGLEKNYPNVLSELFFLSLTCTLFYFTTLWGGGGGGAIRTVKTVRSRILLKRDSGTGVFLRILGKDMFKNIFFCGAPLGDCHEE